jgi:hypothetical protein
MAKDEHEDIGWPDAEELAAMDRAASKSEGFAAQRSPEEIARMRERAAEAKAYRLSKEAQGGGKD